MEAAPDGPDLDLAQVRAFVEAAAAAEPHFGRAARRLGLTQQALSKRVARLETALGVRLFTRTGRGVTLTAEGHRFLAPARRALAAGRAAVDAARASAHRPLRIDTWGHLYEPMRTLATVVDAAATRPGWLAPEPGAARDFAAVAEALRRGEADAGFGRRPVPAPGEAEELTHRPVRLEPVDVVLGDAHPLATASALRPTDLRDSVLRYPADAGRLDFLTRFADHFGVARRASGPNLGLVPLLVHLAATPTHFTLLPADLPLPAVPGVRVVPLVDPTPLYVWSLVWPKERAPEGLPELLSVCAELAEKHRWLEYEPSRDWLPS
ncbi:LysR family transcriptional regulator [Streptomyces huasconensis]|uniref:LysR family transcriptional regulator n=1 Tax=Streptomyces huasconensis TaxID=1854574 RepID=A0ABV3LNH3_9ACTN